MVNSPKEMLDAYGAFSLTVDELIVEYWIQIDRHGIRAQLAR
jgi:hypothetical protein